jgi:hypothetical protein
MGVSILLYYVLFHFKLAYISISSYYSIVQIFRGQRGNAVGFKLSSLTRISDTKSSCNKNVTLLHYIADTCEQRVRRRRRMESFNFERVK